MKNVINFILLVTTYSAQGSIAFGAKNSNILIKNTGSLLVNAPISNYNGTLTINTPASSSIVSSGAVNLLTFSSATIITGQNSFTVTGTYDGSGSDTAILGSGDVLDVLSGTVSQAVLAKGTVGSPSIVRGRPTFSQALTVFDASSALALGVQNELSQNIALNNGTVVFYDELSFANGFSFTGNGTVDINGYRLKLSQNPTTPWTNSLIFKNAKNIELAGYTKLTGAWNFSDPGGVSFLNGNGNVLDLTGGGTLQVASNHTLNIVNTYIKGLGSANGAFNLNLVNGTIKLASVTLELIADYAHSSGNIYVSGGSCKLIYPKNSSQAYYLNVLSTGSLTIDKEVLECDQLAGQSTYPITFTNQPAQLNLLNYGMVRLFGNPLVGTTIIDQSEVSPMLQKNVFLTVQSPLYITNNGATVASMSINGNGYYIQFPTSGSGYLTTGNTLTVNFTNTVFKDYNPSVITNGTSSQINFGSGCIVQLAQDLVLNGGATAMTFNGNSTLDARGKTISISAASKIALSGGSTLTIKNATLNITHANAISCSAASDKVVFSNCNICVGSSGLTWATGNIDVDGSVVFQGANEVVPSASVSVTYSSGGAFRVLTDSTLKFSGNINFLYQANPTTNSDTFVQSKRHFKMVDPSATIIFSGGALTTTATGMALDYGNLIIQDRVGMAISTASGAQLEVGSALNLFVSSGATMEVDGPIVYNSTTYP